MFMPVPVYSFSGAVRQEGFRMASLGKKALILTGKNSARQSGALQDVLTVLHENAVETCLFEDITENPTVDSVAAAAAFGRREQADFVIGIGGGSPMDAAKAAAYLMASPERQPSDLYTAGEDNHLPLALIPTTCGTGSEVTAVSVLTRPEKQTKKSISHKIFADLAFIDGAYLSSAPLSVLRHTALDAFTHCVESYLNTQADDFSRMYAREGLRLWQENRSVLETAEADAGCFQQMMNASAMAGMAIAQTGTGIPHALSYALTYHLHIPHGKAVGYFTVGFLQEAGERSCRGVLQQAGFSSLQEFREWYRALYGIPEVPKNLLESAVKSLLANSAKLRTAPFPTNRTVLRMIAENLLNET